MKNLIIAIVLVFSSSVFAQKALDSYKQVLPSTLKRTIQVNQQKGYLAKEVKPNVYLLTEGIYQSAFVVTNEGVVVIDAPESLGANIIKAVKEVTSQPIVTLVYTHGHTDHIGGSKFLKDIENLEIIALESTASFLRLKNDPRRLVPTKTFTGAYVISKGDKQIHLSHHSNYHSNEGDLFVAIAKDKCLMVIDVLAPGYVPFKDLDLSSNVHAYLNVFDQILAYDFDVFIGGHLTSIGNRRDVEIAQEYAKDVYETVKKVHTNTNLFASMGATAKIAGWNNKYLLFDTFLNQVIDESTKELESRWSNRLAVVDVFTRSHAAAMLKCVRWDD